MKLEWLTDEEMYGRMFQLVSLILLRINSIKITLGKITINMMQFQAK